MAVIPKFKLKIINKISEAPSNKSKIQVDIEDKKTMLICLSLFMAKFQLSLMQRINMAALPKTTLILFNFVIRFIKNFAEEWLGSH